MEEKDLNLLLRLERRNIDLVKMIEKDRNFVASYSGSCSVDGGHLNYTEEQVRVLFASVPSIFPSDWKPKSESFDDLTKEQSVVLSVIRNLESHPAYTMFVKKISPIISSGEFYAGRSFKDLMEMKVLHGYK